MREHMAAILAIILIYGVVYVLVCLAYLWHWRKR